MRRVSFKVAKAIKDAGYTQLFIDCAYYEDNKLYHVEDPYNNCRKIIAYAPTYLDVWLWLWNKGICIEIKDNHYYTLAKINNQRFHGDTPEESIIDAIEYLVDNNLIK